MSPQRNENLFKGQKIFIGIDVHAAQWHVAIYVAKTFVEQFTQPPTAKALRAHLDKCYPGGLYYSAYEAGFTGFSTHYELVEAGITNIVFNPADICDKGKERVRKTDSVDAKKIARNLSKEELDPIYVPTKDHMGDRSITRYQYGLTKKRCRVKHQIKAQLKFWGIQKPAALGNSEKTWSKAYVSWIEEAIKGLPVGARKVIGYLIDEHKALHAKNLEVCRELKKYIFDNPTYKKDYELLLSVPGVGFMTAVNMVLEIGDITRFPIVDSFVNFIGFVPDTASSGPHDVSKGITSRGNQRLRRLIIECAWKAKVKDPNFLAVYAKTFASTTNSQKAIVKVATKLARAIYSVLRFEKAYECHNGYGKP